MKRIYTAVLALTVLFSCQVTDPSDKVVRSDDLADYSLAQMSGCVTMPAELLDAMIGLEAYLAKSDSDKLCDSKYYGHVTDYGSDTYGLSAQINGVNCTVDTDGRSIWEEGAVWEFATISYHDRQTYASIFLDEGATLKMENPGDSTWTFHADYIESKVRMQKSDSTNVWIVEGYCRSDWEDGYSSISTTGADGVTVKKVWRNIGTSYPYQEMTFGGTFSTDFYRDDEKIDFCTLAFRPGFTTSITTSRDGHVSTF